MAHDEPTFWHEKLHVYQRSLAFYSWAEEAILSRPQGIAATDHLDRAAESILESIVSANSSWSDDVKRNHFGIAYGSTLECAACLDIHSIRGALQADACVGGKRELRRIVQMLVGLIRAEKQELREEDADWEPEGESAARPYFDHERLDVYQLALEFVHWGDTLIGKDEPQTRRARRLDLLSTSIVLNVAEGNGRFGALDHRRFIDIAHQSALKSVVAIDLMVARRQIGAGEAHTARLMLSRIVGMLLGLRGDLQRQAESL
jgi:four helix bundle protein